MPANRRELDVDEIRTLLAELGQRLTAGGVEATIYVVDGAAVALEHDTRRTTTDIDAVFHPDVTVRGEAQAMAGDHGLPRDWLNDSVKAFLPGSQDEQAVRLDVPGISVAVASAEHLLAMKMAAYRPGKDQADLELLFRHLGIGRPEQAADIALQVYGSDTVVLPERDELILTATAILDRRRRRSR